MIRNVTKLVCLLAVSSLCSLAQNASGTGGISGVVTDASGAVIPERAYLSKMNPKAFAVI